MYFHWDIKSCCELVVHLIPLVSRL
jgi:hypothetical protein